MGLETRQTSKGLIRCYKCFEILLIDTSTVRLSDSTRLMPLDDCFIMPKIHCLHDAQVCIINMNKKIDVLCFQ